MSKLNTACLHRPLSMPSSTPLPESGIFPAMQGPPVQSRSFLFARVEGLKKGFLPFIVYARGLHRQTLVVSGERLVMASGMKQGRVKVEMVLLLCGGGEWVNGWMGG